MRQGAILYLDEVAEARADAIVVIHSLTDYRRELYLDRTAETPQGSAASSCSWSASTPAISAACASSSRRPANVSWGSPSRIRTPEVEARILVGETGVDEKTARGLVQVANKVRRLTELSLLESVSTRLLVDAAKLINKGCRPATPRSRRWRSR